MATFFAMTLFPWRIQSTIFFSDIVKNINYFGSNRFRNYSLGEDFGPLKYLI